MDVFRDEKSQGVGEVRDVPKQVGQSQGIGAVHDVPLQCRPGPSRSRGLDRSS